jgi:hypothetical protein
LKASQSQLAHFDAGQSKLAEFESRPEPILPIFKSFLQIQKLFASNGKEFPNSISN